MPTTKRPKKEPETKAVEVPDAQGPDKGQAGKAKKGEGGGAPKTLLKPQAPAKELEVGDEAPLFEALDEAGTRYNLSAYRGKSVVLYFYPKDSTPGCTQEACDFRDSYNTLLGKGAALFGVSADSAKAHANFKQKNRLPFPLFMDEDKAICKAYGVWGEKSLYGRKFEGIVRSTFVIDKDGKLKKIFRKVSVAGHAKAVLESL